MRIGVTGRLEHPSPSSRIVVADLLSADAHTRSNQAFHKSLRQRMRKTETLNLRVSVTAGYGSGLTVTTAACPSDGQTIIAYIRNVNAVNMAQITRSSGTIQGWWFNPQTAAATSLGTNPNTATQNFTPPDANDWVLVLDDASANLLAPGTSTAQCSTDGHDVDRKSGSGTAFSFREVRARRDVVPRYSRSCRILLAAKLAANTAHGREQPRDAIRAGPYFFALLVPTTFVPIHNV
jgi:hypothetical protein